MSSLLPILLAGETRPAVQSAYMPDVVVEIAFNAGFNTPASLRTWTDVSEFVELDRGLTINGGRGDERSTADANHLTLTFDNRDGRFTAGRAGSPYFPNVKLDRPIRVSATPVDGVAQIEFLGFVDEWPLDWSDGTDASAYATVTASSRLSRLGLAASLKSIIEQEYLADAPTAYYTLGEPQGAPEANDSSGNRGPALTLIGDPNAPLTFGNAIGPGTDGLTAVSFTSGTVDEQRLRSSQVTSFAAGGTVDFFMLRNGLPSVHEGVVVFGPDGLGIGVDATGTAQTYNTGGSPVVGGGPVVTDGRIHHVAVTVSGGGTWTLYVDGASVGSAAGGNPSGVLELAGVHPIIAIQQFFTGVVAHVATYSTVLSAGRIAAHAAAGLTGFTAETTSARLTRYAGYAGVEAAAINTETGQTTVQHVDTTGKQPVELMRLMETTEGGVLFDDRDGRTTFHNRGHRVTRASSFTLDFAQGMVEQGYTPKLDRTGIANDVTAADVSGRFTAYVFDAASKLDNGLANVSIETASDDDDEPLFQASWRLYKYRTPLPRAASLGVDALAQVGRTPSCAAVMAATVGDKVTVSNHPAQAQGSTATYFVEGWTKVYGHESLRITWNVSPSAPDDTVLVIGDASRGVIGTNPVAL